MTFKDGATLGSFVIGLCLVVLNLGTWWPGRKALRKKPLDHVLRLLPFLAGYSYGILLMLCGGLLGWFSDVALWGGSWVGDGALVFGVGGSRESVQSTTMLALTNGGLAMSLVATAVMLVVWRRSDDARTALWQGVVAGLFTGTVRGWLGLWAIPLASGMNFAGSWLPGASG